MVCNFCAVIPATFLPPVWLHRKEACTPWSALYSSPNKRFYPNIWAQNATKASIFESGNNNGRNIYCRNFQIILDTITNVRCCKTCNCGHEVVTYWITHEAGLFCFARRGGEGSWNCYLYHCGPAQSVLPDLPCARKNSAWIQLKHWTQITRLKGLFNI